MDRFFNLNNPIWKFVGNMADFFILSMLWYLCSLPLFTIGASTAALYYVTLKMASDQEGKIVQQFFQAFRENFRQSTLIWLITATIGIILSIDLYYALHAGTDFASAMLIISAVVGVLYLCMETFIFVLVARVRNTTTAIVRITGGMVVQNFMPIFTGVIVYAGFLGAGLFLFWPLLVLFPGMPAYLNSLLYNRILAKYHLNLVDQDPPGSSLDESGR